MNTMTMTKEMTLAIDALIRINEDGVTSEQFMRVLSIGREEAEQLMMNLHEQGKLELRWVPGEYYNKKEILK
jgi:ATP-dependent Clp protease adapter protein ClpS